MKISGSSKVFGIIGDPVCHSFSPVFWNAAFGVLNYDAVYVPFQVTKENLRQAVKGLRAASILGGNVTAPHKERMFKLCDQTHDAARLTGAVNTYWFDGQDRLHGDNTDLTALIDIFRQRGPFESACVLGAGGAAKAVVHSLCQTGTKVIYWAGRTSSRLKIPSSMQDSTDFKLTGLAAPQITDAVGSSLITINATTLGWNRDDRLDGLKAGLDGSRVFFDLNYSNHSRLVKDAVSAGAQTITGEEMLVRQGLYSFKILTGITPPEDVIRKAVRGQISSRTKRAGSDARFSSALKLNPPSEKSRKELRND